MNIRMGGQGRRNFVLGLMALLGTTMLSGASRAPTPRAAIGAQATGVPAPYAAAKAAADQQAIRDANNNFPFKFRRNPFGFSATLSLPVFNGFARENTLEQAIVARDNQDYAVRTQELQLTAAVTQAYLQLYGLMAVMGVIVILSVQALISLISARAMATTRARHVWM